MTEKQVQRFICDLVLWALWHLLYFVPQTCNVYINVLISRYYKIHKKKKFKQKRRGQLFAHASKIISNNTVYTSYTFWPDIYSKSSHTSKTPSHSNRNHDSFHLYWISIAIWCLILTNKLHPVNPRSHVYHPSMS